MRKQNIAKTAGIQIVVIACYLMLLYLTTEKPEVSLEGPSLSEFGNGTVSLRVKNNNWFSYKFTNVNVKIFLNNTIIGSSDIGEVVVSRNSVSIIKAEITKDLSLQNSINLILGGIIGKRTEVKVIAKGCSVWFGIHAELFNKTIPINFL
jgi:hypothetical protein